MKLAKYEQIKDKKAVSFFKSFIEGILKKRFHVIHWGFWRIGNGKYGLSLYWDVPSERE